VNAPDNSPDLILTARWLVCDNLTPILSDHGVAIKDGKITEIAPLAELMQTHRGVNIVGDNRYALMPGFVNAHHHSFGVSSIMRV